MTDLSSQLRRARQARGMSYGAAADCIGVHRTTFMAWENKGVPKNGTARRAVAEFIDKTPPATSANAVKDAPEARHDA